MKYSTEVWEIGKVKPYGSNPRKIPEKAVELVANSIREFGFKQPIVVDADGVVIAGHTRLRAAHVLGLTEVPVWVASDLTPEQARAYRLADNKTNEIAEWDTEMLTSELDELATDFNMEDFGFDLEKLVDGNPEIVEDDPGEPPKETNVVRGDVWVLGDHVLMCGDSTDPSDVGKLCAGIQARLLFTSPPYSDQRTYNGNKDLDTDHLAKFISVYKPFAEYQAVNLGMKRDDYEIVQYWDDYIAEAHNAGLKMVAWNVWDKMNTGSIGMQIYLIPVRHEWIFVFGEGYAKLNRTWEKKEENIHSTNVMMKRRQPDGSYKYTLSGPRDSKYKMMESVLSLSSEKTDIRKEHPATFPVGLPAEYIKTFTDEGGYVIEPFGGSGSTLIACEQLGRKCRIMELDPIYCQVIINRWEKLTGRVAHKEESNV